MFLAGVEFPAEVLEANRLGKLVIFAGAGISMGPPSNLPSFWGLTESVAKGTTIDLKAQPEDRTLGILEAQGVNVKARVCKLIGIPSSLPNTIHKHLVNLFAEPEKVRIVTTNYDLHLTSAFRSEFSQEPVEYFAPALPAGNDFAGIVYLHGALEQPHKNLVLTDADFGRAYLTDGWARRFLMKLFESFTVLFVGYSHSDVIVTYLARGLTPARLCNRFALQMLPIDPKWKMLGIHPISFEKSIGPNPYSKLDECLENWVQHSTKAPLEIEEQLKKVASQPPPTDNNEASNLLEMLQDNVCLATFLRFAIDEHWLFFFAEKGFLQTLFSSSSTSSSFAQLAYWFASNFVTGQSAAGLKVVKMHGNLIHPVLWYQVAYELTVRKPRSESDFAQWVTLLLAWVPKDTDESTDNLEMLIQSCDREADVRSSLEILRFLITPQVYSVKDNIPWHKARFKAVSDYPFFLNLQLNISWLFRNWKDKFEPKLTLLHTTLEEIFANAILQMESIIQNMGAGSTLSGFIEDIEYPYEDGDNDPAISIIIGALKRIAQWKQEHKPDSVRNDLHQWMMSSSTLLQRLGLMLLARDSQISTKQKLELMKSANCLQIHLIKELRCLLSMLIKEHKTEVLDWLKACIKNQLDPFAMICSAQTLIWLADETKDMEIQDFLKDDESCYPSLYAEARKFFEKANRITPTQTLRAFLGDDFKTISKENVPLALTKTLDALRSDALDKPSLYKYLQPILLSSIELARDLCKAFCAEKRYIQEEWLLLLPVIGKSNDREIADQALNEVIKEASLRSVLPPAMWTKVIERCDIAALKQSARQVVGYLISLWSNDLLSAAPVDTTMVKFSPSLKSSPSAFTAQAINSLLLRLWKEDQNLAKETFADLSPVLEEMLAIKSMPSFEASCNLLECLSLYVWIDASWTKDNMFGLLDWKKQPTVAQCMWRAFLQGRLLLNSNSATHTVPLCIESIPQLSNIREYWNAFAKCIARTAIAESYSVSSAGWLYEFIRSVDSSSICAFFGQIGVVLTTECDKNQKIHIWKSWLKKLMADLIEGVPVVIDTEVSKALVSLSTCLDPVFEQAVNEIMKLAPVPSCGAAFIFLANGNLINHSPDTSCKLVEFLLDGLEPHSAQIEIVEALVKRLLDPCRKEHLLRICQKLGQLGSSNAKELFIEIEAL